MGASDAGPPMEYPGVRDMESPSKAVPNRARNVPNSKDMPYADTISAPIAIPVMGWQMA